MDRLRGCQFEPLDDHRSLRATAAEDLAEAAGLAQRSAGVILPLIARGLRFSMILLVSIS